MKNYTDSELTLNEDGKIYHLGVDGNDIADTVILVGDPARVEFIGSYFDVIRFKNENREFCTLTGTYRGKEITVISTGIGTDNIDIVLTELDAAVNIDLKSRKDQAVQRRLNLIRIGTCGGLHPDIEPGSHIISKYAIGLDGLAHFYQIPYSEDEKNALAALKDHTQWPLDINQPYLKQGSQELIELLGEGMEQGITTTANGFYGPQGRSIRIPLKHVHFKEGLRTFEWSGVRATNLEMETSGLYALAGALGHQSVTVCLVLANRYSNSFEPNYKDKMANLIQLILDRLTK